eukprot:215490-Pyramimonas_sp.AAC.1
MSPVHFKGVKALRGYVMRPCGFGGARFKGRLPLQGGCPLPRRPRIPLVSHGVRYACDGGRLACREERGGHPRSRSGLHCPVRIRSSGLSVSIVYCIAYVVPVAMPCRAD